METKVIGRTCILKQGSCYLHEPALNLNEMNHHTYHHSTVRDVPNAAVASIAIDIDRYQKEIYDIRRTASVFAVFERTKLILSEALTTIHISIVAFIRVFNSLRWLRPTNSVISICKHPIRCELNSMESLAHDPNVAFHVPNVELQLRYDNPASIAIPEILHAHSYSTDLQLLLTARSPRLQYSHGAARDFIPFRQITSTVFELVIGDIVRTQEQRMLRIVGRSSDL